MYVTTNNEEQAINLKESKDGYMMGVGERK